MPLSLSKLMALRLLNLDGNDALSSYDNFTTLG